jgi:hypothetical protein
MTRKSPKDERTANIWSRVSTKYSSHQGHAQRNDIGIINR